MWVCTWPEPMAMHKHYRQATKRTGETVHARPRMKIEKKRSTSFRTEKCSPRYCGHSPYERQLFWSLWIKDERTTSNYGQRYVCMPPLLNFYVSLLYSIVKWIKWKKCAKNVSNELRNGGKGGWGGEPGNMAVALKINGFKKTTRRALPSAAASVSTLPPHRNKRKKGKDEKKKNMTLYETYCVCTISNHEKNRKIVYC